MDYVLLEYDFEERKGVSGVLFPDGTFRKCGNGQHQYLMWEIPQDVQYECLYFSSSMRSEGDGLITHSPINFPGITPEQFSWMESNFEFFDRGQKRRAHFDWGVEG